MVSIKKTVLVFGIFILIISLLLVSCSTEPKVDDSNIQDNLDSDMDNLNDNSEITEQKTDSETLEVSVEVVG